MSLSPRIAKFPVKFPDTRQFAWRLVRSALRRQPASPAPGDFTLCNATKARQWRAFANWLSVSGLRNWGLRERNRRKSPDTAANIPVFRRRAPETEFGSPL